MKSPGGPYIVVIVFLVALIISGILLLITNDIDIFVSLLYSPYSFLLLMVVLVEYIVLKSIDRSKVYRLENQRLKAKRRRETEFRQRMERELQEIQKEMEKPGSSSNAQERLQEILRSFKEF
jgi:amino acid permease